MSESSEKFSYDELFMLGSHCCAIRYEHHEWPISWSWNFCSTSQGVGQPYPFPSCLWYPWVAFHSKITRCEFFKCSIANEARSNLVRYICGARELVTDRDLHEKDVWLLVSTCIYLYQLISSRESFMSGREDEWYPTEGHQIVGDRSAS